MSDIKPGDSVVKAVGKAGGFDLLTQAGELTIDSFLKDGLLKDIPIVGTITKLVSVGIGIKDFLFLRKVQSFLMTLDRVPEEKREKFVDEINASSEKREKVGSQRTRPST